MQESSDPQAISRKRAPGPHWKTRATAARKAQDDRDDSVPIETALAAYYNSLERKNLSVNYLVNVRYHLGETRQRGKWVPLLKYAREAGVERTSGMDRAFLEGWLEHVRKGASYDGYGKAMKHLNRFLKFAVEDTIIPALPLVLKPPKERKSEIKVFTDDEIDRMFRVARQEPLRDWAIFMLMVDTGIRANELCSLRLQDLRMDREEVAVTGKGGKFRVLHLTESVAPLRKYLATRPEVDTDRVFLSYYTTPVYKGGNGKQARRTTGKVEYSQQTLTTAGLYHLVTKWGRLAGITEARCSPHTFRHYYAVSYLRGGGDLLSLQRLLGHSKLEMTERYAKLVDVDIKKRQNQFSPALRLVQARYKKAS